MSKRPEPRLIRTADGRGVSPMNATPSQLEHAIADMQLRAATVRRTAMKQRDIRARRQELFRANAMEDAIQYLREVLDAKSATDVG